MRFSAFPAAILAELACVVAAASGQLTVQSAVAEAQRNAFPIFNSVHSALRQWGSSLDHNGVAMIPATVPKGGLLYHGTHSGDIHTKGLEWLAFSPEHSELFGISWHLRHQSKRELPDQAVLQPGDHVEQHGHPDTADTGAHPPSPALRGYLRTYQASRDLKLLYFDGMSAGKGCLGTMDTQDLVLRLINGTSPCDVDLADVMAHEMERAGEICDVIQPLGYDGLLRTEVGFEVIYCDFDDGGLRLLSQMRRPFWNQMTAWYSYARAGFDVARAATQHYDGMAEAGRVRLDFSRMVSAYFYPVNITYPSTEGDEGAQEGPATPRPLPRLLSTTKEERQAIQHRVREVALAGNGSGIDWQVVTDGVVSRWADRLAFLASLAPTQVEQEASWFEAEIYVATNTYVDYPSTPDDVTVLGSHDEGEGAEQTRCQDHNLQQVDAHKLAFTPEDELIHAAVRQVTGHICETMFRARHLLEEASASAVEEHGDESRWRLVSRAAETARQDLTRLMEKLQWTRWVSCDRCAFDELCFMPMFPLGSREDHRKGPRCVNESGIAQGMELSDNYWGMDVRSAFATLTQGP